MLDLDASILQELVIGGAVMGCGGGGSIPAGMKAGNDALAAGKPRLGQLDELHEDARLVTLSRVGTVSGDQSIDRYDENSLKALRLFGKSDGGKLSGFLPSEVGAAAVTYGWIASALTGIPVIDAPANGRAHPLGLMGSLGLHRHPGHITLAAAVGGAPGTESYLEFAVRANARNGANLIRSAVSQIGVSLSVVRNPLPASYVRKHAAVGGLGFAWKVGRALLSSAPKGTPAVLRALSRLMQGGVLVEGLVQSAQLTTKGGFTVGQIAIESQEGREVLIPVCNEYMMVLDGDATLASFPDLISLFDLETAMPLGSAEVRVPQRVAVFGVPRKALILSSSMGDRSLLRPIERLLQIRFPEESKRGAGTREANRASTRPRDI